MTAVPASASVLAVHRSGSHSFSKFAEESVTLLPGLGVQGESGPLSSSRARLKMSQAATNRAAMMGPITNPFRPKVAMPPRVEISTR
jgi:hypothetical protein